MKLTPTEYVIRQFGSIANLARFLESTVQGVGRWRRDREGRIPDTYHIRILDHAKRKGLDLTPEDLIYGREVELSIKPATKGGKPGFRATDGGTVFTYEPGNESAKKRARTLAEKHRPGGMKLAARQ